jgi:ribosomal protein L24E
MSEQCKTCHNQFDFGIWLAPQFQDEKVLLFCSEKCKKEYQKMKLARLKVEYPNYYKKLIKSNGKSKKTLGK